MSRGRIEAPETANAASTYDGRTVGYLPPGGKDAPEKVWADDDLAVADDLRAANLAAGLLPRRPFVGAAIRRRIRLWSVLAVVGIVVGLGLYTRHPPPYKATTTVLLAQAQGQDAADQMLTDIALAQSRTVAEAAMSSLGLPQTLKTVSSFTASYTVVSVTNQVLKITVSAPSSTRAVSWAKALAAEFLQVRANQLQTEQQLTSASVDRLIRGDEQQLNSLNKQLAALTSQPPTPKLEATRASLQAQQSLLIDTVNSLKQAILTSQATDQVAVESMVKASQVLDKAMPLPSARTKYLALYGGGGLAGGLAVGLGIAIAQALVSTRLRRRDDIAYALGAPVGISLGRVRAGGWLPGQRGLAATRGRNIQRIVAHLQGAVPEHSGRAPALAVVAVDNEQVAALSLVGLAMSHARKGRKVIVADLSPSAAAARLMEVTDTGVSVADADDQQLIVFVPEPDDIVPVGPVPSALPPGPARPDSASRVLDIAYDSADLLLTLAAVDPALSDDHLATWATDSVVMVTAGQSTATKIHSVGQLIRLAGITLHSAILLDADKNDESLGVTYSQASNEFHLASIHRLIPVGRFRPDSRTRSFPGLNPGVNILPLACHAELAPFVFAADGGPGR